MEKEVGKMKTRALPAATGQRWQWEQQVPVFGHQCCELFPSLSSLSSEKGMGRGKKEASLSSLLLPLCLFYALPHTPPAACVYANPMHAAFFCYLLTFSYAQHFSLSLYIMKSGSPSPQKALSLSALLYLLEASLPFSARAKRRQ